MKSTVFISVIIPACNRNNMLALCLNALAPKAQMLNSDQYEVIVTDDSSGVSAEEMIGKYYSWAKWVQGPKRGPAANRNNGAEYANGKWLVFTDDDCLPDKQWLKAYYEAITKHPKCLVFEGKTYPDRSKRSLAETGPFNETGGYLWSCNLAIKKDLFTDICGFDERFPYAAMEDVEFRQRLQSKEYKIVFVENASIVHPWRTIDWKLIKQQQESTLIYLSIKPEESKKFNCKSYLMRAIRRLVKHTIPGIIKYRGRGLKEDMLVYIGFIRMIYLLFWTSCLRQKRFCKYTKHEQV